MSVNVFHDDCKKCVKTMPAVFTARLDKIFIIVVIFFLQAEQF